MSRVTNVLGGRRYLSLANGLNDTLPQPSGKVNNYRVTCANIDLLTLWLTEIARADSTRVGRVYDIPRIKIGDKGTCWEEMGKGKVTNMQIAVRNRGEVRIVY